MVIEPASNNEGEGEHEDTMGAESKEATVDVALPGSTGETPALASEEQKEGKASQPAAPSASEALQEGPPGFLYKVLTFLLFILLSFSYFIQCQENVIEKSVTLDGEQSVIKFSPT